MKLSRRGFIKTIGAAIALIVTPIAAIAKNEERAWEWMAEREVDGAKQVLYGNDKAVAMFNYAIDGTPRACVISSKESHDRSVALNDEPNGFIDGYSRAWSGKDKKQARLITTDDVNGQFEMTEENVDHFLRNFEHSMTFRQSGTVASPKEYVEWHHIKATLPDKEFRKWARETHGVNL